MFRIFSALVLTASLAACVDDATASSAQASTDPTGSGDHRPPPQEALDACASSTAGATCAFDIDSHHVTGTCRQPDASRPLACAPDQPPPH